jgi:Tol biopolymer transport system component
MSNPIPQRTASALFSALLLAGVCLGQTTERVSVDSSGVEARYGGESPSISADGRYVVFDSVSSTLVPGDTNSTYDVFVHDRKTGVTERVSVNTSGGQGNARSESASISADGRYVAFESEADNLVPGDTNSTYDVFVHDRKTGVTERVSVDSSGNEANSQSRSPSISADGNSVAFYSWASNLVPGDTNGTTDIFAHDSQSGVTERVNVDSSGVEANRISRNFNPSISADGRYVAFSSNAHNLVPGDGNGEADAFVHDRQTGITERISVDSSGVEGNGGSSEYSKASFSADSRFVAFDSEADNLVSGDLNSHGDIFTHDRQTGATERVSVSSTGVEGNDFSYIPSVSADGRYVAFSSNASNLVPGDTNGWYDVYVHDRQAGTTERVSVNLLGTQGDLDSKNLAISADGRFVAFWSDARGLVKGDTNRWGDVFVHDRWDGLGQNSIYLNGPATAQVGAPVEFTWQATRGDSRYWLLRSQNMNGARKNGHKFDIGYPVSILARGINATNGIGSHTSLPVPPRAAGFTIYFEVAARDANGVVYDSNVVGVTFF